MLFSSTLYCICFLLSHLYSFLFLCLLYASPLAELHGECHLEAPEHHESELTPAFLLPVDTYHVSVYFQLIISSSSCLINAVNKTEISVACGADAGNYPSGLLSYLVNMS